MTQVEKLVFAAAFAQKANEMYPEDWSLCAARCIKAGYYAVDLLRSARQLAETGNALYADEKIAYNAALEAKQRPQAPRHEETTPIMLKMLDDFLEEA